MQSSVVDDSRWRLDFAAAGSQAAAERRWGDYLRYFSSFDRWDAFLNIADELSCSEFWPAVRQAWIAPDGYRPMALELLTSRRPGRQALMTPEEHKARAGLPSTVGIFRGQDAASPNTGFSWTLDIDIARKFARGMRTYHNQPVLLAGKVSRRSIRALFLERKEQEVLVHPRHVFALRRERVPGWGNEGAG